MKKQGKTIAIANQKGGVAKTTTTVNLGAGLAKAGKKVLMIDLDMQGNLTLAMGIKEPDELEYTTARVLESIIEYKEVSPESIISFDNGVDIIPANIELSGIDVRLVNTMSRETVLRQYIQEIKQNYDYVLIDCSPSLGLLTVNALVASDEVLIPTTPDYLSVKGFELLITTILRVKKQLNPSLEIGGILPTMVDSRTRFTKETLELLRSQYGNIIKVYDSEIPKSIKAVEATASGVSIYEYSKKNKVAEAYAEFTKEVLSNG